MDGIAAVQGRTIIGLVPVGGIVVAEVGHKFGELALERISVLPIRLPTTTMAGGAPINYVKHWGIEINWRRVGNFFYRLASNKKNSGAAA